ncbi:MAG: YihY/virulence factor BrkB family protein [Caldilineaceae bacterium]|nr:YihY/virulence factor BrkB family protein [Caldilineaceae bacterium]
MMKSVTLIVVKTVQNFARHHGPSYAAAIAYHAIISIGPLFFFSLFLAGQFFGREAAQQQLEAAIISVAGEQLVELISNLLQQVRDPTQSRFWTTGISLILLLYATSNVFRQLVIAQNAIWEVEPPTVRIGDGLVRWLLVRLRLQIVGLVTAILIILVLPGSMMLSVIANFLLRVLELLVPGLVTLIKWLSFTLLPTMFIGLCLLGFRLLPAVRPNWRHVLPGAILTGLVMAVGEGLILYFASNNPIPNFFGIAGSVVIVMLWAYFSAFIFLLGAEFTRTYTIQQREGLREID